MSYYGDIRLGDTIDVKFTTRRFTTGAPFTLAGTPAVSAYVGNGTTEITAGITLTVDFDTRTGLNNVRVVASSGNGFATATNVQLVITAGTVDSVSVVGEVVCEFSIENRSALMPTTATRTLDVSAGGEAGLDWANVGSQSTSVNLSATTTNLVNTVTTYTGNTPQTGDAFARLGAPAGASVSADIAAIEAQTDDIGVAGAGLNAIPWNPAWDAEVQSEVEDGLTGYGAATAGDLQAVIDTFIGLLLKAGTVGATGNDTTHVHLDGLTYGNDALNEHLLVILDQTSSNRHATWITDWADAGDLATVETLPFTPASGDLFYVMSIRRDAPGAAALRSALGMAAANLDTQLDALPTAAENASSVWSASSRVLTAGTNIVLAKGTGITGFNDIAAADVWAAATRTLTALDEDSVTIDIDGVIIAALTTYKSLKADTAYNVTTTNGTLATTFGS